MAMAAERFKLFGHILLFGIAAATMLGSSHPAYGEAASSNSATDTSIFELTAENGLFLVSKERYRPRPLLEENDSNLGELAALLDDVIATIHAEVAEGGHAWLPARIRLAGIEERWQALRIRLLNPGQGPRSALIAQADKLTRQLQALIDDLPGLNRLDIAIAPRPVEEFGIRVEPALGKPSCTQKDIDANAAHCQPGPWLATRSPNFVNIRRTAYIRGRLQLPAGNQMSSSFVTQAYATRVALHFSAEAYVEADNPGGGNKRLFVRALIDGKPASPANVVFAAGNARAPRSMIFTTTVGPGIHTAEIQWLVDRGATGYMRNASLLVRTGLPISINGTLSVGTSPGGVTPPSTASNVFQTIPGMKSWVYVPPKGILSASIAGESVVTGGADLAMVIRAVVDGVPMKPNNVVFKRGALPQAHAFTFGQHGLSPGWHYVRFEWFAEAGSTAIMADRSFAIAAFPSTSETPTHPFLSPPSGPNIMTSSNTFLPVPGLTTEIVIGPRGNGEIAAIVSAEVAAEAGTSPVLALAVDGTIVDQDATAFTDGTEPGQAKSFTFDTKRLTAGPHEIAVMWKAEGGGTAWMGDRSLALMSETAYIPDIAEALKLSAGRYTEIKNGEVTEVNDNIAGLEPVIGGRNVLALIWDPNTDMAPNLTNTAVKNSLFGAANSASDYIREVSGGRSWLNNAGVLGPFQSSFDANNLGISFEDCSNGFKNKKIGKRYDALMQADAAFDFSTFDANDDGFLDWQELAIIIVIPQANDFGTARGQVIDKDCFNGPLVLDGVEIPDAAEWYTNAQGLDYIVAAHELAHQIYGLDDGYMEMESKAREIVEAGNFSLMTLRAQGGSAQSISTHMNPAHKLALGWVTPVLVLGDGPRVLQDVKQSNRVLILPHYNHEQFDDEYFILENRQENLPGAYDINTGDSGIAVWHVATDPEDNIHPPRGVPSELWVPKGIVDTQLRRSVRLLRRFSTYDPETGTATAVNAAQPLWDTFGSDLLSGPCDSAFPDNVATWADCSPSGYNIRFLSPPNSTMIVDIDIE